MQVTPVKTEKITVQNRDLFAILDKYVPSLKEKSVVAISSKIVAISEGRVVRLDEAIKADLVAREADYILPPEHSKYNYTLTIKENILIPAAGIDESNGDGYYILWPRNAQKTANELRAYFRQRFSLHEVGIVITDSKTTPLRLGTTGVALAHSGFRALNDYRSQPDIFGRNMKVTVSNIMEALAAAAVLTMGEGSEQTPLAIIEDIPHIQFRQADPSQDELAEIHIEPEDDLYAPLLAGVPWVRGKKTKD
ncbi:putative folate metabolism gamma-glutamate ligase [Ktedonosporobacter rubrisoli]|uniref:Putative folate metabolism gamma-glutamate ligase n=1 Tax=Ktedonosporobacter rubrisoli TaxID=2509675 RepID=A0A4P6JI22_KTERU|nr:coenzyme F420-0:L-glutamate ligase [Ktedonosporobacter rubrisoli]QBD74552.1 putative folate metabolism gamma-glutamate ligase [Ktedonosporobacter rubrisoli]